MNRISIAVLTLCFPSLLSTAWADDASEAKAREALKSATLQNRTLATEKAALAAEKADLEAKLKALDDVSKKQAKRLDEMDKELKTERKKAEDIQAEQTARITRLEGDLAKFKTSLDKWEAAHATIAGIAKKKEAERAKLQTQAAELERKLADCRTRNAELYKLGVEILERYKSFGIGEALAAREPFTKNGKVKLQNLVQDYDEKLLNQTPKP
jgi:chromosome segregation ATPase